MSKLTIISSKEMEKLLLKLGFRALRQNGSHRFFSHEDGPEAIPVTTQIKKHLILIGF